MAQLSDVLSFSRTIAQTDSNGLTDANGIVFANEALFDFHRFLISKGVDASQIQESYRDITANVGTYLYPPDLFFLKAIELNYADSQEGNYLVAQQVDAANLPSWSSSLNGTSFSWLRKNAITQQPFFDDRGDWFEIFPTPTVANTSGIKILYFQSPTPFAATSDAINYPSSIDFRTMGWRIAANYKRSLLDFTSADAFEKEYQTHLQQITTTVGRGSQQPTQATALPLTGFEF